MTARLGPRRMLAGARARVLLAFVVVLAFSTVLSVLAIRELLLARAATASTRSSPRRSRSSARWRAAQPAAPGSCSGDLPAIFDTYFRRNVPAAGRPSWRRRRPPAIVDLERARRARPRSATSRALAAAHAHRARRGEPAARCATSRSRRGRREDRGAFVVDLRAGQRARRGEDAVRVAALVLVSVLLLASALAWVVAGRVLAPLRELRDTARSITRPT